MLTRQGVAFVGVPYPENGANALAHEEREGFGRTISKFRGESLDVTDDVGPAELQESACPVFVIFEVSGKPVGDDNAVKEFSQYRAYDLRTTRGTDGKQGEGVCDKYPEPGKGLIVRVSCFINIDNGLVGQFVFNLITDWLNDP